jgi:hypothetical protein
MSTATPFNALGGYSVGIPPEVVIDSTGNVVNNVNAPNSNVTANRVFANAFLYANGAPLSIGAAGTNTQVQYNNAGSLGASPAFTFNSSTNLLTVTNLQVGNRANLGNVSNVAILGGTNGYFLQTDGAGNLTWAPAGNGGNTGNGVPGGANTQVQFNDAGSFGGDAGFVYNKTSNTLSVANTISSGNAITGVNLTVSNATIYDDLAVGNITASNITLSSNVTNANWVFASYFAGNGHNLFGLVGANIVGQVSFANVANSVAGANVTGQVGFANVANNVAGANVSGQVGNALVAGTVYNSTQSNITSIGNLTSLTVIGNTTLGNQASANYFIGNLFGTANLARNVTLAAQPNITSVGTLTSLTVSGNTTLGNSVTANYFVGNLFGVANSAVIANTANLANNANRANLANAANVAGTVTVNAQPNITSVGTLTSLSVTGNVTAANFVGNFVGNVSNANYSTFAGTVLTNAQPNITSVGTLTNLSVTGTVTASGIAGPLLTAAQPNITSVGTLTSLSVIGNVTAANVAGGNLVNANFLTGTLTTAAQPNINYVGNLGWLNVDTSVANSNGNIRFNGSMTGYGTSSNISITGNLNAGNYVEAVRLIGSLATGSQPNITSVGNLTSLTVVGVTNLGNVGNVKITGGNANFVLSTDGTGNLTWVEQATANVTTPGGLNTYIQFNDNGAFGGDNTLTWNKNTDTMFVGGNLNVSGLITSPIFNSNVANGTAPIQVLSSTPVANLAAATADTVRNASQPNITSVGTLTSLSVSGNINTANLNVTGTFSAGNISTPGTVGTTNLNVTGNGLLSGNTTITSAGNLIVNGRINAAGSSNVFLGSVSNVKITGGLNGYVLSTDGAGNLSWAAGGGGGGNGTPGGSNTQVQYNDSGAFGGSAFFTFNEATNNVQIAGNLIANSVTMGAGIYEFSHSNVFFATTSSIATQTLLSIDAADVAAVDYTIISTDGAIRNFIKISTVISGSVLNYVEYSTLPVNGYTGDFVVEYDAGNITSPPTIQLKISPQSANLMTHKMSVTTYKE